MPLRAGARRKTENVVRRRAAQLMHSLRVEAPLDVEELCARLSAQRGRPIRLVPHAFPSSSAVGLWLGTAEVDLLLYERHTTRVHQQHIVLHEVGHVVLDHGQDVTDDAVWRALVPTLPPAVVRRALLRSAYDTVAETEAELFASVASGWVSLTAALGGSSAGVTRLERAIDDPCGGL